MAAAVLLSGYRSAEFTDAERDVLVVAWVDVVGGLLGCGDDEDRESDHRQQCEAVPRGPSPALVVVESDLCFGFLEGLLDHPARPATMTRVASGTGIVDNRQMIQR